MGDTLPTISGSVADALNLSAIEVSDLLLAAPLVARLGAEESSDGTFHRYPKETGAPVVGFRAENAGREFSTDSDEVVDIELKILDWSHQCDKAVADAWRKGGKDAYLARKGFRHLRSALSTYEKQVINGTGNDGSGFEGMADADTCKDLSGSMVVNAAGSTPATGSSVWAVRLAPDAVMGVYKGDGLVDLGETSVIDAIDGSGKHFPAYYKPACTWLGLQVGSIYGFGRICNLTEDSGKGLNDDLIADLLSLFPSDQWPTLLLMNRRSLAQLRKSRTATNPTGAPAPFPTEAHGVEIVPTDSIGNTETLLS